MSEVKITKKISFLETLAVISFCFGSATIIYFMLTSIMAKKVEWNDFINYAWISIGLLLIAVITNKWANCELKKLYDKELM